MERAYYAPDFLTSYVLARCNPGQVRCMKHSCTEKDSLVRLLSTLPVELLNHLFSSCTSYMRANQSFLAGTISPFDRSTLLIARGL